MSRPPSIDAHTLLLAIDRDLEHQVLAEREAMLRADELDESEALHREQLALLGPDPQPFAMPGSYT